MAGEASKDKTRMSDVDVDELLRKLKLSDPEKEGAGVFGQGG